MINDFFFLEKQYSSPFTSMRFNSDVDGTTWGNAENRKACSRWQFWLNKFDFLYECGQCAVVLPVFDPNRRHLSITVCVCKVSLTSSEENKKF